MHNNTLFVSNELNLNLNFKKRWSILFSLIIAIARNTCTFVVQNYANRICIDSLINLLTVFVQDLISF
jgi:low affinity Fe/Cu permease